jgi:hypothetical protein
MKVTFLRGTALGGIGNDAYPGDVRDLPDARALSLIAQGRAVAGDTSPKKQIAKAVPKVAPPAVDLITEST